jgi:hypothetical protein
LASRIHFGFPQGTRTKGDHFAGRNDDGLACVQITSLARTFLAHGKPAKASDDDRFSLLKSGPEKCKNPFEQVGRLSFRNAGLLMNASGNIRFCHAVSFSFGKNFYHGSLDGGDPGFRFARNV